HHDLHAQAAGGAQEVGRSVRRRRQQQEYAGHRPIMAVMTDLPAEEPILRLTDEARTLVIGLRADEPNADELALWVEISGVTGGTFAYDVYFQATSDAGPADAVIAHDHMPIVIPAASVDQPRGPTLDVDADGGMNIKNPNSP